MTLTDNITGLQCSGHLDFRIEFKLVNFYLFIDIIDIKHPLGKTSGDLAEFGPVALYFMIPKLQLEYIININMNLLCRFSQSSSHHMRYCIKT